MSETTILTDAEIAAWALDIGEKYHVDQNFERYAVFEGEPLTPQNSDEMEARYLVGLKRQQAELGFNYDEYAKWLCLNDLYYLAKFVLGYDKLEFYFHWPMCQFYETEVERPGSRTNIQMPRGCCKTTIFTIAGSIRDMLRNRNIRIAIWSHDVHHAARKLDEAKKRMIESEVIQKYFPEWIPRDKKAELGTAYWTSPARTKPYAEHTMEAGGILGGHSGFHHDKIILDDAWSAKSVTSQKVIADTSRRVVDIENMVITTDTCIMAVNTRWAHDDPSEMLRKNPAYVHLRASVLNAAGKNIYPQIRSGGLGDPLRKLHQQAIDDEYHFMCQKMTRSASTTQGFDPMWFKYESGNEWYRRKTAGEITLRTVLLTDLAGTASATSNFAAAVVLANDNLGRHMVLAVYRRRMTPLIFTQLCFSLADRWNVQMIVRQKAPLEIAMHDNVNIINRERIERGEKSYAWYDFSLSGSAMHKDGRIGALSFPLQRGVLFFNEDRDPSTFEHVYYRFTADDAVDMSTMENQLTAWRPGVGGQDNIIDALSMLNDPAVSAAPQHSEIVVDPGPMTCARFKAMLDASPDPREAQVRERREKMVRGLDEPDPVGWPFNVPGP